MTAQPQTHTPGKYTVEDRFIMVAGLAIAECTEIVRPESIAAKLNSHDELLAYVKAQKICDEHFEKHPNQFGLTPEWTAMRVACGCPEDRGIVPWLAELRAAALAKAGVA